MEKLRLADKLKLGASAGLVALGMMYGLKTSENTSPEDALFRDQVLEKYGVRQSAQNYIREYPFKNTHGSHENGGGLTFGDRWEVHSNEHEALIHEASHVFAKHVMNPDFCLAFDETLKEIADLSPKGSYFQELYYGDEKDFSGLAGNCTEQFASISSFSMGSKDKIPQQLQFAYRTLYEWGGGTK